MPGTIGHEPHRLGTARQQDREVVSAGLSTFGDPTPLLLAFDDLDGHTRILCDRVDMGVYEYGIGDFDCDGIVELGDFAAWEACMTGPNAEPRRNALERGTELICPVPVNPNQELPRRAGRSTALHQAGRDPYQARSGNRHPADRGGATP